MTQHTIATKSMKLVFHRDDSLPAFAAFAPSDTGQGVSHVVFSAEAIFTPGVLEDDTPGPDLTPEERKVQLIGTFMHEFGHALEEWLGLEGFDEAAIDRITHEWEARALGLDPQPEDPSRTKAQGDMDNATMNLSMLLQDRIGKAEDPLDEVLRLIALLEAHP